MFSARFGGPIEAFEVKTSFLSTIVLNFFMEKPRLAYFLVPNLSGYRPFALKHAQTVLHALNQILNLNLEGGQAFRPLAQDFFDLSLPIEDRLNFLLD